MNIFYLDSNPEIAAQLQCDKHVVKMTLESAQLLSTTMHCLGSIGPYKKTHENHPCAIWVRSSNNNYKWLLDHFIALCYEYTRRYGKVHKCQSLVDTFSDFYNNWSGETKPYFDPPQTILDECKGNDTVIAYQKYYRTKPEWIRLYKNREIPVFLLNND